MSALTVRRIPFEFPEDLAPHWNAGKPEWSQMVNDASLVMPYLEPWRQLRSRDRLAAA